MPTPIDQRLPPPGTILTRPYKGQQLHVQVLTEGFAYAGTRLSLAQRRGQGHHRHAHQRLPLLPQHPQPQQGDRMNHQRQESRGHAAAGALRHLHTQVHRGRTGARVQLAGCPTRVRRSLHPQPDQRRLDLPARPLRRRRLHRRQHGTTRPATPARPTSKPARSIWSSPTKSIASVARCSTSPR